MSYQEQLKSSYSEIHKRLMGNQKPAVSPAPPPKIVQIKPQLPRKFYQLSTEIIAVSHPRMPKLHQVLAVVSKCEGIELEKLTGPRRQTIFTNARQIFYYLAYYHTRCSLNQIGNAVGGKDHTTVLYGVRKVEKRIRTDEQWRERVRLVTRVLKEVIEGTGAATPVQTIPVTESSLGV